MDMEGNTMKAAILYGKEDLRVEHIPVPKYKADEVLVHIKRVGICGSDIHYYKEGRIGDFVVEQPMILGHESAGVVVAKGSDVTEFEIGNRVAIEPGIPCMKCRHCKEGRYNLCQDITFFATPPVDGSFCEYVAFQKDYVFKLPESMSLEEGSMIEPLAVGLFAVKRAQQQLGDTVLILGSGTIGLMTLQAAKAAGAGYIIVADIDDKKLKFARDFGADLTVNTGDSEDAVESLKDAIGDREIDVVYDAVGIGATALQSVELARIGGKIIWIGLSNDEKPFPFGKVTFKELEIRGMFRYANMYPVALKTIEKGLYNLKDFITRHVSMDELPKVMEELASQSTDDLKVIVDIGS
jgi:L-iditol 2-dehydrogenase